jgi:hypothetical protein
MKFLLQLSPDIEGTFAESGEDGGRLGGDDGTRTLEPMLQNRFSRNFYRMKI